MEELFKNKIEEIFSIGSYLLKSDELKTDEICKQAKIINFQGYDVPAVNSPILNSEIGNNLLQLFPDAPFSISWFLNKSNKFKLSLRSRGDFDVSVIAKKFGGGGHPSASGLVVDSIPGFEQ